MGEGECLCKQMQAYHSEGRPIHSSHWAEYVLVCKVPMSPQVLGMWARPCRLRCSCCMGCHGGSENMRQLLSPFDRLSSS